MESAHSLATVLDWHYGEAMSVLDGHVLITGASSGIGQAMAIELATRAQSLVLVARRADRLMALSSRCRALNPNLVVHVMPCDLSNVEKLSELIHAIQSEDIAVTTLINNAGLGQIGLFEDLDPTQLEVMLMVNVVALTLLTRAFLPGIVESKGGVLNVSSGFGLTWMPYFSAYVGTKHFVSGMTASLRAELSGTGVVISQLCPGPVATEFVAVAGNPLGGSAPSWIELSSEECARIGLRGFERGREIIVPGFWAGLSIWLGRLTPRFVLRIFYGIIGKVMRKRLK